MMTDKELNDLQCDLESALSTAASQECRGLERPRTERVTGPDCGCGVCAAKRVEAALTRRELELVRLVTRPEEAPVLPPGWEIEGGDTLRGPLGFVMTRFGCRDDDVLVYRTRGANDAHKGYRRRGLHCSAKALSAFLRQGAAREAAPPEGPGSVPSGEWKEGIRAQGGFILGEDALSGVTPQGGLECRTDGQERFRVPVGPADTPPAPGKWGVGPHPRRVAQTRDLLELEQELRDKGWEGSKADVVGEAGWRIAVGGGTHRLRWSVWWGAPDGFLFTVSEKPPSLEDRLHLDPLVPALLKKLLECG